ncbi:MAG: cytochrome C [Rhodospirillaceae bacterium]|nr:cytochrome C [Rhodospirillaceae bacterium]|tara:strand:- start:59 stop:367 length:309 start_codon:yes stop_codon:yes gene_type:complete
MNLIYPRSFAILIVAAVLTGGPASSAEPGLCTSCHRADGRIAPDLAGRPSTELVAAIAAFRSGRRSHPHMETFAKSLSDDDIAGLAAHFQALRTTGPASANR